MKCYYSSKHLKRGSYCRSAASFINSGSANFKCAIILLLLLLLSLSPQILASPSSPRRLQTDCVTDVDCKIGFGQENSRCLPSGMCSNPYEFGCLRVKRPEEFGQRRRHCNSDDEYHTQAAKAAKQGLDLEDYEDEQCEISPMGYPEIRIHNQNWEVAVFFSWIFQIFLSEELNVPTTVGLTKGEETAVSSFYSPDATVLPMSAVTYGWDGISKANEVNSNCLATEEQCAHMIPDVWLSQRYKWEAEFKRGQVDNVDGNGQVGGVYWYIPTFTMRRYPAFLSHLGLRDNMALLASVFKRPTTWRDYCEEVSTTNCTEPDDFASEYPPTEEQGLKYFHAPEYIGHFRATKENDCTASASSPLFDNSTAGEEWACTGHIINAGCFWATFVEAQTFWNNIALKSSGRDSVSGGYTSADMADVWYAANATKSDVIIWWYEPSTLVEAFRDSEFAFNRITLPPATVECRDIRVKGDDLCDEDIAIRRGPKEGSCGESAHVTKKVIASSLRDAISIEPEVSKSPAYEFLRNFNMDELALEEILRKYDREGATAPIARELVCEWVSENLEYLRSFSPPTFPRAIVARDNTSDSIRRAATALGGIAAACVLILGFFVFKFRKVKVFIYAQVTFIFVVLLGLLVVSIGSILFVTEPNQPVCTSRFWLVSLGYTCVLIPLIIKVAAINQLMRASKRMRRIRINPTALYAKVLAWLVLVMVFLIVWTVMDPPTATETRVLSNDKNTIYTQIGCLSSSEYWTATFHIWDGLLVLTASILAFQSRNAKAEFNESRTLGMIIYSHFMFLVLRLVVVNIFPEDVYTEALATSFLLSADVIMAVFIYLVPKFVHLHDVGEHHRSSEIHGSRSVQLIQAGARTSSSAASQRRLGSNVSSQNSLDISYTGDSKLKREEQPTIAGGKYSDNRAPVPPPSKSAEPMVSGEVRNGPLTSAYSDGDDDSSTGPPESLRDSISNVGRNSVKLLLGPATEEIFDGDIVLNTIDPSDHDLSDGELEE